MTRFALPCMVGFAAAVAFTPSLAIGQGHGCDVLWDRAQSGPPNLRGARMREFLSRCPTDRRATATRRTLPPTRPVASRPRPTPQRSPSPTPQRPAPPSPTQTPQPSALIANPLLVFAGRENYATATGSFVRYRYHVSNKDTYPAAMFAVSPNLPPCGNNTNSSRTWIDFFDSTGHRLYGFCALATPQMLDQIWFALPEAQLPPGQVYIEMIDRLTNRRYRSNLAGTLVNPRLAFTGQETYTANGRTFVRYRYDVLNRDAYPAAMFAAAPNLPPCGTNTNSSRTWVDFFDQSGSRLYGFCALGSPQNLNQIWFALPEGQAPPGRVYIEMIDRLANMRYRSNLAGTAR